MLWCDPSPHAYNSGSYRLGTPGDLVHQTILVLDFGSQFTQLIARRLRELSVYSEILPFNTPVDVIRAKRPVGLILSGGPKSVSESDAPNAIRGCFDWGCPRLASATACS